MQVKGMTRKRDSAKKRPLTGHLYTVGINEVKGKLL